MNKIVGKEYLSEKVVKFEIEAPLIAKSRKAGHFVIVRIGEKGERIPYTIVSSDPQKGTITLVVQNVGKSSEKFCELNVGDYVTDLVGPLGKATHIDNFGTVLCAGGGVGIAPILPIVEAMKKAGNKVIAILAARTKELMEYEKVKNVYVLHNDMLKNSKDNLKVLHPLPRVKEIDQDVDDNPKAYYFQQARNGMFTRQAVICDLMRIEVV
jgi:NAD(P)H-flavin reductase